MSKLVSSEIVKRNNAIVSGFNSGKSYKDLIKEFDMTYQSIYTIIKNGTQIEPERSKEVVYKTVRDLYAAGKNMNDIKEASGLEYIAIRSVIMRSKADLDAKRKRHLESLERKVKGEIVAYNKTKETLQKELVAKLHETGLEAGHIAKMIGTTAKIIRKMLGIAEPLKDDKMTLKTANKAISHIEAAE